LSEGAGLDRAAARRWQSDGGFSWGGAQQPDAPVLHGHRSTASAQKRGHEAKLAYCGNVMIESRNGLVVDTELLQCNGTAERDAALLMAERVEGGQRVTLAADKGYEHKGVRGRNAAHERNAPRRAE
jgi:hypothetical protein